MIKYLFLATLLGCSSKNPKGSISDTITSRTKTDSEVIVTSTTGDQMADTSEVIPDTTINKKLILENYSSIENYFPKMNNKHLVENLRYSPVVVFLNVNKDEYLLAYQYEGNTSSQFSMFEVGRVLDLSKVEMTYQTNEKSFETESGLRLGLTLNEVVAIKSSDFTKTQNNGDFTLTYRIQNMLSSPFLQRYKMPGYTMELDFKDGKVRRILFGFDYP